MKKRNLFVVVAMFSIFLFGIGAAYAITGVDDAVPGQDQVIPMICEGYQPNNADGDPIGDPVFGTLNTIWAIAEVSGLSCTMDASVCVPKDMAGLPKDNVPGVVYANVYVYDRLSERKLDISECWSKHDVISNQCTDMIMGMTSDDRDAMEVTIRGVKYFVGYVEYRQARACDGDSFGTDYMTNSLVSWVYLNDVSKGFVTGFNGVSLENGTGPGLTEYCDFGSCDGNDIGITARTVFPRYYILNNDPDTFTWWIFLLGRNEYFLDEDVPANSIHRELTCFFCNENEVCTSNEIDIPYELNIIDVAGKIPGGVWPTGWPISDPAGKRGFAYCDVDESGSFTGQLTNTTIAGTLSFDDVDSGTLPETYSLFGWSYQRAFPAGGSIQKLAVVHPIHRLYCSDEGDAWELPERFEDRGNNTVSECYINGIRLTPIDP